MKIYVVEACDGFSIVIQNDCGNELKRVWFCQEETKEELVDVFKYLGFESEYEEDY